MVQVRLTYIHVTVPGAARIAICQPCHILYQSLLLSCRFPLPVLWSLLFHPVSSVTDRVDIVPFTSHFPPPRSGYF